MLKTKKKDIAMGKLGHHILFYRNEWEARPDSRDVRRNPYLIPPLERDVHDELHRNVQYVPSLGRHLMALIKRDYLPIKNDYIGSIESLMFEIEEKAKDRRVSELEARVSEFTIHAIELQLPFIREGLIVRET